MFNSLIKLTVLNVTIEQLLILRENHVKGIVLMFGIFFFFFFSFR